MLLTSKIYIKPDGKNEIIILRIKPNKTSLVQHKTTKIYYGRFKNENQTSYSSDAMTNHYATEMILQRHFDQEENNFSTPNKKIPLSQTLPTIEEIFDYIRLGDMDKFKTFLKKDPFLKLTKDSVKGNNVLIEALQHGQESFAEFLLKDNSEISINPYHINYKYDNALFVAVHKNQINIVKLLLENYPALFKSVNTSEDNAFIIACRDNSWDIVEYLLEKFPPRKGAGNKLINDDLKEGIQIIDPSAKINSKSTTNELIERIKEILSFKTSNNNFLPEKNSRNRLNRDNLPYLLKKEIMKYLSIKDLNKLLNMGNNKYKYDTLKYLYENGYSFEQQYNLKSIKDLEILKSDLNKLSKNEIIL